MKLIHNLWRIFRIIKARIFPVRSGSYYIGEYRLAITNICNARCVFCSYPGSKMNPKVMSMDVFQKTIPFWRGQKVVDMTPAIGEPLVDDTLGQKVAILREHGSRFRLTTNAILLDRHLEWIGKELWTVDQINISIPSFDPKEYQEQFGVDSGKKSLDNLKRLLIENDKANQPIRILVQIRNRFPKKHYLQSNSFEEFRRFFYGKVRMEFTHLWENWSGHADYAQWSKHMLKRMKWSPQINRPCKNMRGALINPDGSIRLCGCRVIVTDHDDMLIGTVNDSNQQLWERAYDIREKCYLHIFPFVCRGCSFYNPE